MHLKKYVNKDIYNLIIKKVFILKKYLQLQFFFHIVLQSSNLELLKMFSFLRKLYNNNKNNTINSYIIQVILHKIYFQCVHVLQEIFNYIKWGKKKENHYKLSYFILFFLHFLSYFPQNTFDVLLFLNFSLLL